AHGDQLFNMRPGRPCFRRNEDECVGAVLQYPIELKSKLSIDLTLFVIPVHTAPGRPLLHEVIQPWIGRVNRHAIHRTAWDLLRLLPCIALHDDAGRLSFNRHVHTASDPSKTGAQILIDPGPDGVLEPIDVFVNIPKMDFLLRNEEFLDGLEQGHLVTGSFSFGSPLQSQHSERTLQTSQGPTDTKKWTMGHPSFSWHFSQMNTSPPILSPAGVAQNLHVRL